MKKKQKSCFVLFFVKKQGNPKNQKHVEKTKKPKNEPKPNIGLRILDFWFSRYFFRFGVFIYSDGHTLRNGFGNFLLAPGTFFVSKCCPQQVPFVSIC